VDADFSDLLIIIGQVAGLDYLWMQIFEVFIHPSLGRWIGFSVNTFSMVRPLDWISVDSDF
jgi:hypothetical protein